MVKQLSKEEITTIKIMREQGCGARTIGRKIGRSDSTIQRWFDKLGLPSNLKSAGGHNKPRVYPIVCKECGESYDAQRYNAKFCSDKCRLKHNKATILRKPRECKGCGVTFESYNTKYCTTKCYDNVMDDRRRERLSKRTITIKRSKCVHCDSVMLGRKKKYCSKDCRYKYNYVSKVRMHNIKCKECGKHKEVTLKRKSFCSVDCDDRYWNRQKETNRRMAMKENGRIDWDISIERLLKRDGHKCYICDKAVIMNGDTNHDLYPSIEHVKAIANGGTHTWDNVKIAHRKCNWEKGINEIECAL